MGEHRLLGGDNMGLALAYAPPTSGRQLQRRRCVTSPTEVSRGGLFRSREGARHCRTFASRTIKVSRSKTFDPSSEVTGIWAYTSSSESTGDQRVEPHAICAVEAVKAHTLAGPVLAARGAVECRDGANAPGGVTGGINFGSAASVDAFAGSEALLAIGGMGAVDGHDQGREAVRVVRETGPSPDTHFVELTARLRF